MPSIKVSRAKKRPIGRSRSTQDADTTLTLGSADFLTAVNCGNDDNILRARKFILASLLAHSVPRVLLLGRAGLGGRGLFGFLLGVGFRGFLFLGAGRRSGRARGIRGHGLPRPHRLGVGFDGQGRSGNKRKQRNRRDKRLHEGTPG